MGSARVDLVLAGLRLGLSAEHPDLLDPIVTALIPPCARATAGPERDWTLRFEQGATVDPMFDDRPVLTYPGGMRLAVTDARGPTMTLAVEHRPGAPIVGITVDVATQSTRITLPARAGAGAARVVDWLARVFFASRLLASGWWMLHASAVACRGEAVLFVAGQGGGKSTLAYRACTELGAAFLADDLILVGPDRTVIGWPARIALPAQLLPVGAGLPVQTAMPGGWERKRVLFSPAEYPAVVGFTRSVPVPLGAVVSIVPANRRMPPMASRLAAKDLDAVAERAAQVPAQRLHVSDLLGLTGGPPPAGRRPGSGPPVGAVLAGVPAAVLCADPVSLSTAPVWVALAGLIPHLEVR